MIFLMYKNSEHKPKKSVSNVTYRYNYLPFFFIFFINLDINTTSTRSFMTFCVNQDWNITNLQSFIVLFYIKQNLSITNTCNFSMVYMKQDSNVRNAVFSCVSYEAKFECHKHTLPEVLQKTTFR